MMIIQKIDPIIVKQKENENIAFQDFLKSRDGEEIDSFVSALNKLIEPQIDCTSCGNCCKSLMIVVEEKEAITLSNHLQISVPTFEEKYIEKGANGMMLINQIPCCFLNDNKCTVYDYRFAGCREFPALHIIGFTKRLFTVFMHYDRCPIIYNVIEQLKLKTGFSNS
jgi:uncharacterized protein